jgi:phosphate transport system substrate-binding protein
MTMNDDFLYRIRAEPPPRFIVSLKERLNQLENVPTLRRRALRRNFFVGSLIAGAVLATGLFVSRTMYSPPADKVQPMPTANPALVDEQLPGLVPRATDSTKPGIVITSQGKAAGANRTAGQLGVGATVALYPSIKEATRLMNKNMNVYPPFPEPTFTMMTSDVVFPSLCAVGNSVDTVVVDRRVLPEELDACRRINKHIAEVKFGYEAIVLARSNLYDAPKLSTRSIFLALAREIPNPSHPEELIKNPNVTWDQVDSALPSERIDVAGPPPSSATGIAFRDLILKTGCLTIPTIASLKEKDPVRFEEVCGSVRTDGVYRVRDLSSDDLVGHLQANPEAIALLNYKEMLETLNLAAGSIDGVTPSRAIIYSGSYVGARVLYLYANTAVPHMREFVWAICSSVGGASADTPLIAIDAAEQRSSIRQQVLTLPDLKF